MKVKYMLITLMCYFILMGCSSCGVETTNHSEQTQNIKITESEKNLTGETTFEETQLDQDVENKHQENLNLSVKLTNTYKAKEGEVNKVDAPEFSFDYPDNWSIETEIINGEGGLSEVCSITNERGVEITYVSLGVKEATDYGRIMYKVDVSKVGKTSFAPGYVSATDYSSLGKFVVAKIKVTGSLCMDTDTDYIEGDGGVTYAVLPESLIGKKEDVRNCGYYTGFSFVYFSYPSAHAFFATSPDGKFTEQEEREVIAILSSFREE